MSRMLFLIFLSFAFTAAAGSAQETAHDVTFARGVEAYEDEDYAAAAQQFQLLVAEGVREAPVFYNLAHAFHQQGRLGPAIANYERALQHNPHFAQARRSLRHALAQTEQGLVPPEKPAWRQALLTAQSRLAPATTVWLAVGFWGLFWGAMAACIWRSTRWIKVVAALSLLFAALFAAMGWVRHQPARVAVASVESVPVRYGIGEVSEVRFELHEGDRVTVDRQEDEWIRIESVEGGRGWAPQYAFTLVGPPYETAPTTPEGETAQ
ncbi:MAG: tetratricopeptide repeat protein [Candidatus Hydrogenedentota bacterium]